MYHNLMPQCHRSTSCQVPYYAINYLYDPIFYSKKSSLSEKNHVKYPVLYFFVIFNILCNGHWTACPQLLLNSTVYNVYGKYLVTGYTQDAHIITNKLYTGTFLYTCHQFWIQK